MTKAAVSQFTSAKLENAKSVKNSMTDQWQNSSNIIDSFDVLSMLNLLNQASLNKVSSSDSKAAELPAFYQCLDHSCINV